MQGGKPIIYLATPYRVVPSAADHLTGGQVKAIQMLRFKGAGRIAYALRKQGWYVFCPMTHTLPVEREVGEESAEFWLDRDEPFMDLSAACFVGMMPGWEHSSGVAHEVERFERQGKPVEYISAREHFNASEWRLLLQAIHNFREV